MFSSPLKVLKKVVDLRYLSPSSPVTLPPLLPGFQRLFFFVREITAAKLFAYFFRQRTPGARVRHRKPTPVNAEHTKDTCVK